MLWQQLVGLVRDFQVDQFLGFCLSGVRKVEREWKEGCVRFLGDGGSSGHEGSGKNNSEYQVLLSRIVHSKTTQNLHKTTKITHIQRQSTKVSHTSALSSQILETRANQIQKFKKWRSQHIEKQKIYYHEELSHPLLMIQNHKGPAHGSKQRKFGSIGLVVFVHGFKGSEYDLEKASQYLTKYNQNVQILRISSLQNEIDYLIEQMAIIVANEIKKHIMTSLSKFDRISIVGYSLGGILTRAALPHLHAYQTKLHTFITFSSPHLGTYATNNNLVKFGIWYMTKFGKCAVLEQLHTCRDLKTSTKSYMKRLSEEESLGWFQRVVLVSCKEDQFVPHVSSRVDDNITSMEGIMGKNRQIQNQGNSTNKFKNQMIEMSENIRKYARNIERVEVWFDNEGKKGTLDKLTGRQSHIEFLDNCRFLKWFFQIYGPSL